MSRSGGLRLDGYKGGAGGGAGGGGNTSITNFATHDGPFLHAVVVAEPYRPSSGFLSPVTPHKELPFALLPICNTPLIDYILENLMENHVDMVTVLVRENDVAIRNHLEKNATVVGQTWIKRGSLTVKAVLPSHGDVTLYSACSCIVNENVVAQGGSILLFPVNAITAFTDLRRLFQLHTQRAEKIHQYAATVLCTPTGETLKAAFHNTLESVYGPDGIAEEMGDDHHRSNSGAGDVSGVNAVTGEDHHGNGHHGDAHHGGGDSLAESRDRHWGLAGLGNRARAIPTYPKDFHTIIAFDEDTEVVSHMARFEVKKSEEEDLDLDDDDDDDGFDAPPSQSSPSNEGGSGGWGGDPAKIVFTKATQCVRMDLIPTNYMFLCENALPLVKAGAEDVHNFLNEILATSEVTGNCFGLMEMPRVSGMIETITTMDSFIRANLDVCGRRFYPMTRESCFAEPQLSYEVAPWCETVYLHTSSRAPPGGAGMFHSSYTNRITSRRHDGSAWERMMGPYAVLGPRVSLPAETYHFCGVSCDQDVVVGKECSMVGCVIMCGAKIGARCQLRYVIVGKNAVIGDDVTLVNCMVEHGAVVSRERVGVHASSLANPSPTSSPAVSPTLKPICHREGESLVQVCNVSNLYSPSAGSPTSSSAGSSPQQQLENGYLMGSQLRLRIENMAILRQDPLTGDEEEEPHLHDMLEALKKNAVLPTEALFIDDPVPHAEDEDDEAVANDGNIFSKIVRNGVRSAYLQPYSLSARRVELTTSCVSYGVSYPQLCRVVTRLLIRLLANSTKDMTEEEEILDVARPLFKRWMEEFYDYILINNAQEHQSMLFILEGLCEGIVDDECHLYWHIPCLIDLLYDGCDRETFISRGYCLVASTTLTTFVQHFHSVDDSDSESESETESEEEENVYDLYASQACAKHIEQTLIPRIREKTAKFNFFGGADMDDSDDTSSDDEE